MTNTVATNVSKNCDYKKVRCCYLLNTVLYVIILLLIIIIISQNYMKHRPKQEGFDAITI